MRYGLVLSNIGSFSDPATVIEFAQKAEEVGWESLFLWDHLAWVWAPHVELGGADRTTGRRPLDPWTMLGAVAARTERLLLGTCVTPVPRRRPQVLALQLATLDELSGGRAILGAGLGGNRREFEEFGESFDRERRWQLLEEGLGLIRELWAGPLGPRDIPIWIGGNSTRARRLAAQYEGWMPDSTSLDEMSMTADDIRDDTQKEIAVMGYSEPADHALHDAYADAGTTWWLESLHDRRGSRDELLARVAAGP
jgi:alkanesulfonate monooxygenase SsuD/methylene tetrahydromethanopterin reductase-like flavin-dependent oxidoreductase (luciferase family)